MDTENNLYSVGPVVRPSRAGASMSLERHERLRERARKDCIKYGAPNLGVDHSNHYKKIEELMGPEKEKEND